MLCKRGGAPGSSTLWPSSFVVLNKKTVYHVVDHLMSDQHKNRQFHKGLQ
jgi:hypothetical protein